MNDTETFALSPELEERLAAVEVADEIFARWPDYRVLVIVADGLNRGSVQSADGSSPLSEAEETVRALGVTDWTTHPHIAQWMEAFKGFGAKPKRTSPSALALLKRVNDGLPRIDPITDCYNAISISHVLPIGGEDFAAYVGHPRLVLAAGDEPFDTIDQGEPVIDHPAPGEVIWRDDLGVTCRRWNWRQGVRTRITGDTTTALFILEALGAMPDDELLAAGAELNEGLRAMSPAVAIGSRLIRS